MLSGSIARESNGSLSLGHVFIWEPVYLVVYITMPQHQSSMFPVLPLLSLLSLEMHTCMHHCSTAITTVSFGWQATDIGRVSVGLANFWVK